MSTVCRSSHARDSAGNTTDASSLAPQQPEVDGVDEQRENADRHGQKHLVVGVHLAGEPQHFLATTVRGDLAVALLALNADGTTTSRLGCR